MFENPLNNIVKYSKELLIVFHELIDFKIVVIHQKSTYKKYVFYERVHLTKKGL